MTDERISAYYRWYERTYAEIVDLASAAADQPKWIAAQLPGFSYPYSSIWRHESMMVMKYYAIPHKTDYICTVFKVSRPFRHNIDYQTTYAFLYSSVEAGRKPSIQHEYVAISPTFTSADGEYRHSYISVRQFTEQYAKFPALAALEKHALAQIGEGHLALFSLIIGGNEKQHAKVARSVDTMRLPIQAYTWALYELCGMRSGGFLENHLTAGYSEAVLSAADLKFYQKHLMVEANRLPLAPSFRRFLKESTQLYSPVEIGQKIIPLTVKQVEDLGSIKHSTWAEIHISILAGNLVINGISPTYPIFNNWFLLKGKDPGLYDNQVMHIKLSNSDAAESIVRDLEKARGNTYLFDFANKREIYLSYNMEGLSQAIEIPMDYAEEEMVVAGYTLCTLTEHVGRTMADQAAWAKRENWRVMTGDFFTQTTWLAKYMFEYLYGIYALNLRAGIIHGDLHLNNITIFSKRDIATNGRDLMVSNPTVLYRVHDKVYIFPTTGRSACIIDFSRAIIGPDSPLGKDIAVLGDQHRKIMRTYEREFPEFYQAHKSELQVALIENYPGVFRVFTAFDAYKLTRGMLILLSDSAPATSRELLTTINRSAQNRLTLGMIRVFEGVSDQSWPLLDIIEQHFATYLTTSEESNIYAEKPITIVDYFSIDNPLRYDSGDYEKFPPTVKFDYIIEHDIPQHQIGLRNYSQYIENEQLVQEEAQVGEVSAEERAHKAQRRGSNVTATDVKKMEALAAELSSDFYFDT